MTVLKKLFAITAVVGLAACTYPAGPGSTNLVDGSYQGRARLLVANNPFCPAGQYGVFEIGDRLIDVGYVPGLILEAAINPDGSLHAQQGKAVLDGHLTGEHLELTVTTPDCQTGFSGNFIWNHS